MMLDFSRGRWINKPRDFHVTREAVEITTGPDTDFWQRTYYGFRNDNGPALLVASADNFTFTAKATFSYRQMFDQCGLIIYVDSENWVKASIEYEQADFSRLGSVVTNHGYSDWATTDIPTAHSVWFRLSRRGPDFLLESSSSGKDFQQMRIFHLHCLGETTVEMGKQHPPAAAGMPVDFGVYACSPLRSSFTARFEHLALESCGWQAHSG